MESIDNAEFDVVISGTGLPQSLLALALSRSGKKILHVDRNGYYGGTEAALSLQDAEDWVKSVNEASSRFSNARITKHDVSSESNAEEVGTRLGFPRAYSLALAPQLIYSRSVLLPTLVSSRVYRQLEFLAVGAWWIYESGVAEGCGKDERKGILKKIPGGREDVFADKTIDLKAKSGLMKFLRFVADAEAQVQVLEEWGNKSFEEFLTEKYAIPPKLQSTLHALTLSPRAPSNTPTSYALPRINRHLTSIGMFGPGFGSVIPKWGGLAEVAQVSCRAGAVGGGVYMLGCGIQACSTEPSGDDQRPALDLKLSEGGAVKTCWTAGTKEDLPLMGKSGTAPSSCVSRSISIVTTTVSALFPPIADGAPPSACAVVVFPAGSLYLADSALENPIYLMIHSSDAGECPNGQCVIYASAEVPKEAGQQWLRKALDAFLASYEGDKPRILWTLSYHETGSDMITASPNDSWLQRNEDDNCLVFPNAPIDLAFDDKVLYHVKKAWEAISGESEGFMQFQDREAYDDDGE